MVVDAFTKYIFTEPLKTGHPRGVIQALTSIFTRFGQPLIFIADNGSEFHNKEVVTFLRMWGVQWHFPTAYNPQANGQAESGVKIIARKLRLALLELDDRCSKTLQGDGVRITNPHCKNMWPILLPYVTMSHNRSPNDATGFSPFELMFGKAPHMPIAISLDEIQSTEWRTTQALDHLSRVQISLKEAYDIAQALGDKKRQQMKAAFDRYRPTFKVQIGDFVYIAEPFSKKLKKFQPRAYGPFPVTHVTHHPQTNDIVGIQVDTTDSKLWDPPVQYFARRRLRPLRFQLPKVDWQALGIDSLEEQASIQNEINDCAAITDLGITMPTSDKLSSSFSMKIKPNQPTLITLPL